VPTDRTLRDRTGLTTDTKVRTLSRPISIARRIVAPPRGATVISCHCAWIVSRAICVCPNWGLNRRDAEWQAL
jgi:hypothetical protein